jgi:DNA primase
MNIIDFIQADGIRLKKEASTHGGEYSGACPACGGKDRFRVWSEQGENGRYWCRQCGKHGDAIQYLREFRKLSYKEACQLVGKKVDDIGYRFTMYEKKWIPRQTIKPEEVWQKKALEIIEQAEKNLWNREGAKAIEHLRTRGLKDETIKKQRLGWIEKDTFPDRKEWGFEYDKGKDGEIKKKLWLPRGILIPYFIKNIPNRIRIRTENTNSRYVNLTGSNMSCMHWHSSEEKIIVVVESELDGCLIFQEAGDLISIIALGNAQSRPDKDVELMLEKANLILNALDNDNAGGKEAWTFWKKEYPKSERWITPKSMGKDPGDAYKKGLNIREWIKWGIEEYSEKKGISR